MRTAWCLLLAGLALPAIAREPVVVLQYPATAVTFADPYAQRAVVRRLGTTNLSFRSGERFAVPEDNRHFRLDLVAALLEDPKVCLPPLKTRFTNALSTYHQSFGPFWIAIPVGGKVGKMTYWRYRPEVGVSLYKGSCERQIRRAARRAAKEP